VSGFIAQYKSLPKKTKFLLHLGILFALFIALPLFVYTVTTQVLDVRNRATYLPYYKLTAEAKCIPSGDSTNPNSNVDVTIQSDLPDPTKDGIYGEIRDLRTGEKLIYVYGDRYQEISTVIHGSVHSIVQGAVPWSLDIQGDGRVYQVLAYFAGYSINPKLTGPVAQADFSVVCPTKWAPTITPTSTPTATPTVTPSPTPTSSTEPNNCGGTCGSNGNCAGGLFCYNGYCRNPFCPNQTNCSCATPTPTPTQKPTKKPTATPKPKAGKSPSPTPFVIEEVTPTPEPSAAPLPEEEDQGLEKSQIIGYALIGFGGLILLIAVIQIVKSIKSRNRIEKINPTNQNPPPVAPPIQ